MQMNWVLKNRRKTKTTFSPDGAEKRK